MKVRCVECILRDGKDKRGKTEAENERVEERWKKELEKAPQTTNTDQHTLQ